MEQLGKDVSCADDQDFQNYFWMAEHFKNIREEMFEID